jgi:hypothetical protein
MLGDLECQKCPAVYQWRGTKAETEAAARFNDWKVFDGPTMGGGETHVVLCADCGGSIKRARHRAYEPLDGQESFDLE